MCHQSIEHKTIFIPENRHCSPKDELIFYTNPCLMSSTLVRSNQNYLEVQPSSRTTASPTLQAMEATRTHVKIKCKHIFHN